MQRASDEESAFAFKLSSRTQPRRIQSGRCEVRRVDSGGVRTDSRHRRTCCCFFGVRRSASRTPVASVGNRNSTPLCVAQASACVHCLCFRCHPEERILRSRSPQCGLRRRLPEDLASALSVAVFVGATLRRAPARKAFAGAPCSFCERGLLAFACHWHRL